MNRLEILRLDKKTYRVLEITNDLVLVVDCNFVRMPYWINKKELSDFKKIEECEFLKEKNIEFQDYECYNIQDRKKIQDKYASICPVLAVLTDERDRSDTINYQAEKNGLNRKTIIRRLYLFLVYQDIRIYSWTKKENQKDLSNDEKNYRYILNKYFYTRQKRTLVNCYLYLLKEKYTENGRILEKHPSIHQFRYFYYKTKKLDSYFISREGRSEYDRNIKPLLGKVRNIFNTVGYGMVDNTTLDLYVLDDNDKPRRPIFSAMVDAYSGLCLGFAVSFEGGETLLKKLITNVNTNKVQYCSSLDIQIDENDWPHKGLPQTIITDNGSDFVSKSFTQLTELGITIQTNKSHYPQMKPNIERFFGVLQSIFKPYLFNVGVVNKNNFPDNPQKRAVLNLQEIEKILCRSIIHYNSKKIQNLPFGKEDLLPHSNSIFLDNYVSYPNTFITVPNELLKITMMKRSIGKFTRFGLKFGKFYYKAYDFINEFLAGNQSIIVAFDEKDISKIYGNSRGFWVEFEIIDEFFNNKNLFEAEEIVKKNLLRQREFKIEEHISEIKLAESIEDIVKSKGDKL